MPAASRPVRTRRAPKKIESEAAPVKNATRGTKRRATPAKTTPVKKVKKVAPKKVVLKKIASKKRASLPGAKTARGIFIRKRLGSSPTAKTGDAAAVEALNTEWREMSVVDRKEWVHAALHRNRPSTGVARYILRNSTADSNRRDLSREFTSKLREGDTLTLHDESSALVDLYKWNVRLGQRPKSLAKEVMDCTVQLSEATRPRRRSPYISYVKSNFTKGSGSAGIATLAQKWKKLGPRARAKYTAMAEEHNAKEVNPLQEEWDAVAATMPRRATSVYIKFGTVLREKFPDKKLKAEDVGAAWKERETKYADLFAQATRDAEEESTQFETYKAAMDEWLKTGNVDLKRRILLTKALRPKLRRLRKQKAITDLACRVVAKEGSDGEHANAICAKDALFTAVYEKCGSKLPLALRILRNSHTSRFASLVSDIAEVLSDIDPADYKGVSVTGTNDETGDDVAE